jgi:hypothetical protein
VRHPLAEAGFFISDPNTWRRRGLRRLQIRVAVEAPRTGISAGGSYGRLTQSRLFTAPRFGAMPIGRPSGEPPGYQLAEAPVTWRFVLASHRSKPGKRTLEADFAEASRHSRIESIAISMYSIAYSFHRWL